MENSGRGDGPRLRLDQVWIVNGPSLGPCPSTVRSRDADDIVWTGPKGERRAEYVCSGRTASRDERWMVGWASSIYPGVGCTVNRARWAQLADV